LTPVKPSPAPGAAIANLCHTSFADANLMDAM
jgi:hypothetical protein